MPNIQSFDEWENGSGAPQGGNSIVSFDDWEKSNTSQKAAPTRKKIIAKAPSNNDVAIDTAIKKSKPASFLSGLFDAITPTELPKVKLPEHKNPVANFLFKDLPEDIVNQPASSLESFNKLQRSKKDKIIGKSGMSAGQELGEGANVALAPLMVTGGGEAATGAEALLKSGGKAVVKELLKRGAITGAELGGAYGGLQGLHEGEDKGIGEQAVAGAKGAIGGALAGGAIGGLTGAAGGIFKNMFSKDVAPEVIAKAEKTFTQTQAKMVKTLGRDLTDEESTALAEKIASEQFSKEGTILAKGGKYQTKSKSSLPLEENITQAKTPVNKLLDDVSFEPEKEKSEGLFSKVYTKLLDRFHPINKLTNGLDVKTAEDPKFLIKRYLGIQGIADAKINWKTTRLNPETGNVEVTGEGLQPIIDRFKADLGAPDERDLVAYMISQHYQELLNRGINPLEGKKATAQVSREAQEAMAELTAKYGGDLLKLDSTAKDVRQWSIRAMLDPLLEVGRLDQETYNKIVNSNQFYVPLKRVMEELETKGYIPASTNIFVSKGNPLKSVRGSKKSIVNPLESLISDSYRITDLVERDRVARAIVGLRNKSPELAEMITETTPKMAPAGVDKMTAEVDKDFVNKLVKFSKSLGLTKFKTSGQAGKNLGYFTKAGKETGITRRFGTSRETLAHEVGHFLDDKFSLYQKFLRNAKATRKAGDEIYQHSVEAGESASRLKNGKERFANAFSWWMTHRDLAEKDMPKFSKAMQKILGESPELKPLLNIKPSPQASVETMDKTIFRPNLYNPGENVVTTFDEGKMKFWKVPEDVFKAVSGMNEEDMNVWLKLAAVPATLQRAGATLAPEFVVRNPVRDQFSAFIYSKYGYRPPIDFMSGLASVLKRDDAYQSWLASGGAHSTMVSIDRESSKKTLDEVMKRAKFNFKNPLAYAQKALGILQNFSETTEQATRVGMFKRSMQKGANSLEAVYESREGTLDFANRGAQTRALNAIISFWNATVQGQVRMVRAFKERPMQTSMKAVGGITLPSLLLYAVNKDNPRYQELPQWQKDFFWIIIPPGDKTPIIRIPKPFELGLIFGTAPEHFMEYLNKQDPQALSSLLEPIINGGMPGVIPTAMVPPLEVATNHNFFTGLPIDSTADLRLPAEMRGSENTAVWAKEMAKAVKEYTKFGASPDKIEHIWTGYTATLGRSANAIVDSVLVNGVGVEQAPKPEMTAADIPVIKGFVAREPIGSSSKSVNDFYTNLEVASQSKAGVKELMDKGQQDDVIKYLKDNPEAYMATGMEGLSSNLADLRKARVAVLSSKTTTPADKRRIITQIDTQTTKIAQQANAMFKRVVGELRKQKEDK